MLLFNAHARVHTRAHTHTTVKMGKRKFVRNYKKGIPRSPTSGVDYVMG